MPVKLKLLNVNYMDLNVIRKHLDVGRIIGREAHPGHQQGLV